MTQILVITIGACLFLGVPVGIFCWAIRRENRAGRHPSAYLGQAQVRLAERAYAERLAAERARTVHRPRQPAA